MRVSCPAQDAAQQGFSNTIHNSITEVEVGEEWKNIFDQRHKSIFPALAQSLCQTW